METMPILISAVKSCTVPMCAFNSPLPPPVCSSYFGVELFVTQVLLKTMNRNQLSLFLSLFLV